MTLFVLGWLGLAGQLLTALWLDPSKAVGGRDGRGRSGAAALHSIRELSKGEWGAIGVICLAALGTSLLRCPRCEARVSPARSCGRCGLPLQ